MLSCQPHLHGRGAEGESWVTRPGREGHPPARESGRASQQGRLSTQKRRDLRETTGRVTSF